MYWKVSKELGFMRKNAGMILIGIILLAIIFVGGLTFLEYKPKDVENSTIIGNALKSELSLDREYTVATFNIGYAALSEEEDFFMDGGDSVRPKEKALVEKNLEKIRQEIRRMDHDFIIVQEIDEKSKRSYGIDQVNALLLKDREGAFAYNFKAKYVPFPFPPIGEVNSGILTMGKFKIKEAQRISLPNPFSWPIRTVNLKRALQITRYTIKDSLKEFVLINFHLEAFDSGEGKREQTRLLSALIQEEFEKGNYVVAGGDWNQTLLKNWTFDDALETQWKPGDLDWDDLPQWDMGVDEEIPTNRSLIKAYTDNEMTLAKFFIDGFIVSPNIKIKSTQVNQMDFKYSDHEPVTMTFSLEEFNE